MSPQIFDSVLTLKLWGLEATAAGLPAIVALILIIGIWGVWRR
jgi:hypothetical protein